MNFFFLLSSLIQLWLSDFFTVVFCQQQMVVGPFSTRNKNIASTEVVYSRCRYTLEASCQRVEVVKCNALMCQMSNCGLRRRFLFERDAKCRREPESDAFKKPRVLVESKVIMHARRASIFFGFFYFSFFYYAAPTHTEKLLLKYYIYKTYFTLALCTICGKS